MNFHHVFWGAIIISIVIVSWVFYRFIAPKNWREWTNAGIVQAFIIAFYAEMYGFPITIYLLTRWFGLDISNIFWKGNLWVNVFGTPLAMILAMILGYAIAAIGIILLITGWRELYRAKKAGRLAMSGPYKFIRHPQYLGIYLAIFGEGVVHWPTVLSLVAFPIIVVAYFLLAKREERNMLKEFGKSYQIYQQHVPMFSPPLRNVYKLIQNYLFK